jgi:hypothetical protein
MTHGINMPNFSRKFPAYAEKTPTISGDYLLATRFCLPLLLLDGTFRRADKCHFGRYCNRLLVCLLFVIHQVQKYWFPENEMKKRYPQIQGFYAVSSFNGEVS